MAKLPIDNRLQIEKLIEDKEIESENRGYLGISMIAEKCPRKLWYEFRMVLKDMIPAKLNRLFQRGHREEPIIIKDLESIGVICHSDQKEVVTGYGHIKGHIDGLSDNIPDAPKTTHLNEFKTANDKGFKAMCKDGVKKAQPKYYGQMVCYMFLLKIKRALFIMVNKNDDGRYYERVEANDEKAKELIKRAVEIITTEIPPERIGNSTWYECGYCKFKEICHFGGEVEKNCRTCCHVAMLGDGKWKCDKKNINLCLDQQKIGCSEHELLETLRG